MDDVRVRDLMVPLSLYGTVNEHHTLAQALGALDASRERLQSRGQPARAVLVVDDGGRVVGQVGQVDFLKALEPKFSLLGDLDTIARAGVSEEFVDSLVENLSFFRGTLDDLCHRAGQIEVRLIMRPVRESIDEDAPLTEAIHRLVMWQTMRVLVTRKGVTVGVLRLTDVFEEVARRMDVRAR